MTRLTAADFTLLLPALKRLGLGAVLVGSLYGVSAYVLAQTEAALRGAEARLAEERNRYYRDGRIRQTLRTYEGRFTELRGNRVIDDDPRLAWVETVQRSADRLGLRTVSFQLEPTAPLTIEHPPVPAPVAGSTMTLHLGLVHEGELVQFLEELQDTAPGLVWVRQCTLNRVGQQGAPAKVNLEGDCVLAWLTVRTQPVPRPPPEVGS